MRSLRSVSSFLLSASPPNLGDLHHGGEDLEVIDRGFDPSTISDGSVVLLGTAVGVLILALAHHYNNQIISKQENDEEEGHADLAAFISDLSLPSSVQATDVTDDEEEHQQQEGEDDEEHQQGDHEEHTVPVKDGACSGVVDAKKQVRMMQQVTIAGGVTLKEWALTYGVSEEALRDLKVLRALEQLGRVMAGQTHLAIKERALQDEIEEDLKNPKILKKLPQLLQYLFKDLEEDILNSLWSEVDRETGIPKTVVIP